MEFYDKKNEKILCFTKNIKRDHWDNHWLKKWEKSKDYIYKFFPNSIVCKITSRFLHPKDGPILEGGCGLAQYVYSLNIMKYDVIGIDNAVKIIEKIKQEHPNLNVEVGDVRKMRFPENYFAGYWSIGVIEHFFFNNSKILSEMRRIIKPKGYLFITFPYMSPLRVWKAKCNIYKIFNNELYNKKQAPKSFYQFILRKDKVINDIEKLGFKIKFKKPISGIKGLKDEIFFLKFFFKRFLQLLYDTRRPRIIQLVKGLIEKVLVKFTGHSILLVFQKKN